MTLFDEPIVVARRPSKGPAAMIDRCPHRAAALSEGLLTADGSFQCAYHGWTFDGETGDCTKIPQLAAGAASLHRHAHGPHVRLHSG